MFGKRVIERPPIGLLTRRDGVWESTEPPPPVDSRGAVRFRAGVDGPTAEQTDAVRAFASSYTSLATDIAGPLFAEYRSLTEADWGILPAASAAESLSATRLIAVDVKGDCSMCLMYGLYYYHPPSRAVQLLDHQLNVVLRGGRVCEVLFEG